MADYDLLLNNGAFLRLYVAEVQQDVGQNISVDTWQLTLHRGSNTSSWTNTARDWSVNLNGVAISGKFTFDFRSTASVGLGSGNFVVQHNDDGTKAIAVYSAIGSTGTAVGGPVSGGWNFIQSAIPRASQPSLSPQPVEAGSTVTLSTNRASAAFTHTVEYYFGNASAVVANNITDTLNWVVPMSLLNEIPSAPSGTGYIRLVTYNGGNLVGVKTTPFTVSAPASIVPTFTTITHSENVSTVQSIVGAYVKLLSRLNLAITGAAGVYGSTIASYKITVAGQTINAVSGLTAALAQSGNLAIVGTVTDTRGRIATKTVNITVLDYASPVIDSSVFGVIRANAAGASDPQLGDRLKVMLKAATSSLIVGGVEKNNLSYKIYTRQRGTTTWTLMVTQTPSGTAYNSFSLLSTYSVTMAWEVLVEVYDQFSLSNITAQVAVAAIFMDWNKNGLGLGKFWEQGGVDAFAEIFHNNGVPVLPAGNIELSARTTAAAGRMLCNGASLLVALYPRLFAAIGYTYGGSGTSFNIPNLVGKVPVGMDATQTEFNTRGKTGGAKTHTLSQNEMPVHKHTLWDGARQSFGMGYGNNDGPAATFRVSVAAVNAGTYQGPYDIANAGGGAAHNNLQPYIALNYYITL